MENSYVVFLKAAIIRAIRTAAQCAAASFTVGMAVSEIDWVKMASVAFVAAVYSLVNAIATGLPEAPNTSASE